MARFLATTAFALFTAGLAAQPVAPPPMPYGWCATSPEKTAELRSLHEWRKEKSGVRLQSVGPRSLERDGLFIVETDQSILANDDLLDLVGSTVRLQPLDDGFVTERLPIDYEEEVGELVADFASAAFHYVEVDLPFSFPFRGHEYDRMLVSSRNGVFFEYPPGTYPNQYDAFDAVSIRQPVIAPLLIGSTPRTFVRPEAWVRASQDDVVVTWRTDSADFAYDVQVRLSVDGGIDLSWRSAREVQWGVVVVTGGYLEEELQHTPVLRLDDAVNDSSSARADLDLQRIEVDRLDGTDLLEVRLQTRGFVFQPSIPAGEYVQFGLTSTAEGASQIVVHLTRSGSWILLPGRGWIASPSSLQIETRTIRFLIRDYDLQRGESVHLNAWIWDSSVRSSVDGVNGTFDHEYSSDRFELDLTEGQGRTIQRPLIEAFTLPDMDPYAVWELLEREYGLNPAGTDALAIYQDFFTDLVLYAGAYSTVGNPGVDGISDRSGYGIDEPRSPALLHMSKLGYRYNSSEELSIHVLNHEFGHRWLYFFEIMEDGKTTHALNPAGGHPAQFVHTPAAFDILGTNNSSAMGGAWFEDLGNGSFRTPDPVAAFGYSWHELYLMGLARPEEVEPWYYVAGSVPQLGDAYYPPAGIVVSGTRRDVRIEQVIEAMGPRVPGYDGSRKRFTTFFVLLVRDLDEVTESEIQDLDARRRLLQSSIPIVTGGRGSIVTQYEKTPRRRGVSRP